MVSASRSNVQSRPPCDARLSSLQRVPPSNSRQKVCAPRQLYVFVHSSNVGVSPPVRISTKWQPFALDCISFNICKVIYTNTSVFYMHNFITDSIFTHYRIIQKGTKLSRTFHVPCVCIQFAICYLSRPCCDWSYGHKVCHRCASQTEVFRPDHGQLARSTRNRRSCDLSR